MAPTVIGGGRRTAIGSGNFATPFSTIDGVTSELVVQWPLRASGTFSRVSVNFDANGTVRAWQIRRNGANSTLVLNPPDSTAIKMVGTSAERFVAGDTFDLLVTGTGTGFQPTSHSLVFSADAGTFGFCVKTVQNNNGTAAVWSPDGGTFNSGSETPGNQFRIRAPAIKRNLVVFSRTNAGPGTNVVRSRKNNANGNMAVTIGSTLTGVFEDTTNSDTVASGDFWNYQFDAGGVSFTCNVGHSAAYTTTASEVIGGGTVNTAKAFNAANQFTFILYDQTYNATESVVQGALGLDGLLSNMRLGVFSNAMAGTYTVNLRKNGANTNQSVSVAAGTTGAFEDTTHSDTFTATDLLNYMYSGGVSGSILVATIATTLRPINADPGAFALTGNAARFAITEAVTAGAFALTGNAAQRSPQPSSRGYIVL
jgi:hypothetical protein